MALYEGLDKLRYQDVFCNMDHDQFRQERWKRHKQHCSADEEDNRDYMKHSHDDNKQQELLYKKVDDREDLMDLFDADKGDGIDKQLFLKDIIDYLDK